MKKDMLSNLRKMLGMRGGAKSQVIGPADFKPDASVSSDRQYMTNQEFTNSYKQGGDLPVHLNALANPTLTTPTNNC